MRFLDYLLHLFTPRYSNNHRARLLHPSVLSLYIVILVIFQLSVSTFAHFQPEVLGYATNISVQDLLSGTNAKRLAAGVSPLRLDDQLTKAAAAKAADMFAHQYWAHISPSGTSPWTFVAQAGYNYLFAGENLARDFADSASVVEAWMKSSTHRENLLDRRYEDIGLAVVNGKYGGSETTLVVQTFGKRASAEASVEAKTPTKNLLLSSPVASISATSSATPGSQSLPPEKTPSTGIILQTESVDVQPKIDLPSLVKLVSLSLTVFLISLLALDAVLVYRRRQIRVSGHTFAHFLILFTIMAVISLVTRGAIL